MKNRISKFALLMCLFSIATMFSQQTISGHVYRAKDSTALFGVSIYYDGTSIGTTTNEQGYFSIEKNTNTTTPLLISSIGYENVLITNYNNIEKLATVYLSEKLEELDPVVLEGDTWSRRKKMMFFKREFIGPSKEASKCKIKNPEVISLRYQPSSQTLYASSNKPIILKNKYLGYKVTYELLECEINFDTTANGFRYTNSIFYAGRSFFEELSKKVKPKYLKHRDETYYGSLLQFLRALRDGSLAEKKFRIFYEKFEIPPYSRFKISNKNGLTYVQLIEDKLSILYKDFSQSAIQNKGPFSIDEFGNHNPPRNITVSGDMASKRIAHLLPLNYKPHS